MCQLFLHPGSKVTLATNALEKLNEIICDNYTLTHMSGKTQTKQEFIDEIMDGTLNYYKSTINDPDITLFGENKAIFKQM